MGLQLDRAHLVHPYLQLAMAKNDCIPYSTAYPVSQLIRFFTLKSYKKIKLQISSLIYDDHV